jgi:hypothetical protein
MTSTLATTPAPAWNTKGNKSLRSLREKIIIARREYISVFNSPLTITNGTLSGELSVTTEQLTANEQGGAEVLKNQKKKIKRDRSPSSRESAYCRFAQNLIFL